MDYVQILGIRKGADAKEIKKAYVRLIKQFKPDSHPIEFGEIREAYELALKQFEWECNNAQHDNIQHVDFENSSVKFPTSTTESLAIIEHINVSKNKQNDKSDLTIFLERLDEIAQNSSELASKELTSIYINSFNKTSLDEKFNIEIELLTWIFNTDKPLLLAFLQIDDVFNWTKTGAYTIRAFNEWETKKLFFLRKLAETYNKAIVEKDSNLVSEGRENWRFIQSLYNINRRKEWQSITQFLGYENLKNYFKPPEYSKFQIIWSDLIVASLFGGIGLLIAKYNDLSHYLIFSEVFAVTIAIKIYLGNYLSAGLNMLKMLLHRIDQRHVKIKNLLNTYKFKNSYALIFLISLFFSLIAFETTQNEIFHRLSLLVFASFGLVGIVTAAAILIYLLSALLVIFLGLTLFIANTPYTIAYFIEYKSFQLFKFLQPVFQKPYPWTLISSESDIKKRRHWQQICEDLKRYFKSPPKSKFSITWADTLSAFALSLIYEVTTESNDFAFYSTALIAFLLTLAFNIFVAPFIVRRFKFNSLIKNYKIILIIIGSIFLLGFLNNKSTDVVQTKALMCNGLQSTEAPLYPKISRRNNEEGNVLLELNIGIDGSVISANIKKSSGFYNLDKAALDKAKTWCFVPFKKNGVLHTFIANAPISFKLDLEPN